MSIFNRRTGRIEETDDTHDLDMLRETTARNNDSKKTAGLAACSPYNNTRRNNGQIRVLG